MLDHIMNAQTLTQADPAAEAVTASHSTADILQAASSLGFLGGDELSAPQVLAALCNPKITVDELSELLNNEPGLVVRVLRVANSSFYGVSRSVATIDRALMILGFDSVRSIAAAACLDRSLIRATSVAQIDRQAMVRHSLTTATAAEGLARLTHRESCGDAFVAGLLHNLGVPVQAILDPSAMRELTATLRSQPAADIRELESQCNIISHEDCAARIFEQWQLPDTLVQAARHHHEPLQSADSADWLAGVLHTALRVCSEIGHGFESEPAQAERNRLVMDLIGVNDDMLESVKETVIKRSASLRLATGDQ